MLREPADRTQSDFWYWPDVPCQNYSTLGFHTQVVAEMAAFTQCVGVHGEKN